MIAGAIEEEVLFCSWLGVIKQSIRAVVAGTMFEVEGTVGCLLVLDCVC